MLEIETCLVCGKRIKAGDMVYPVTDGVRCDGEGCKSVIAVKVLEDGRLYFEEGNFCFKDKKIKVD